MAIKVHATLGWSLNPITTVPARDRKGYTETQRECHKKMEAEMGWCVPRPRSPKEQKLELTEGTCSELGLGLVASWLP